MPENIRDYFLFLGTLTLAVLIIVWVTYGKYLGKAVLYLH